MASGQASDSVASRGMSACRACVALALGSSFVPFAFAFRLSYLLIGGSGRGRSSVIYSVFFVISIVSRIYHERHRGAQSKNSQDGRFFQLEVTCLPAKARGKVAAGRARRPPLINPPHQLCLDRRNRGQDRHRDVHGWTRGRDWVRQRRLGSPSVRARQAYGRDDD